MLYHTAFVTDMVVSLPQMVNVGVGAGVDSLPPAKSRPKGPQ